MGCRYQSVWPVGVRLLLVFIQKPTGLYLTGRTAHIRLFSNFIWWMLNKKGRRPPRAKTSFTDSLWEQIDVHGLQAVHRSRRDLELWCRSPLSPSSCISIARQNKADCFPKIFYNIHVCVIIHDWIRTHVSNWGPIKHQNAAPVAASISQTTPDSILWYVNNKKCSREQSAVTRPSIETRTA